MTNQPFWKGKKLEEFDREQWESLCDGCAKCCLYKLQDEDTGEIFYTSVVCGLLDTFQCRCGDYPNRRIRNPECLTLTPENVRQLSWIPDTCAYRLLAEGKDLPEWHHLVSGSKETVHLAGNSVRGKCISGNEIDIELLEDFIIENDSSLFD